MMSRLPISAPTATTGLLVALALVLGQWLHEQLPERADSSRPYEIALAAGEVAELRTGDLRVVSIDGAASIAPSFGDPLVSPGVFAVVELAFTPRDRSTSLTYAALRDNRGRVLPFFGSSGRSSISCTGRLVDRPVRCVVVVEADPDTLTGAAVAVAPSGVDERWDSMAVIELGVDERTVTSWRERTDPLALPEAGEMLRTTR